MSSRDSEQPDLRLQAMDLDWRLRFVGRRSEEILSKQGGCGLPRTRFYEWGDLLGADWLSIWASGMESAAGRRIHEMGGGSLYGRGLLRVWGCASSWRCRGVA